jgi:hypothetical protein
MRLLLLFLPLILIYPVASHAILGEMAEPANSTQRMPSAFSARTEIHQTFTVRTTQSDATTVREFIAPSGIVFAVTWNGIARPDLSILLGSYNGEYESALNRTARVHGRRSRSIRTDRVVVEHWGHMRDLSGRAYDPSLIPGGVSLEEIQ